MEQKDHIAGETLQEAEALARNVMGPELKRHTEMVQTACNLIVKVSSLIPVMPLWAVPESRKAVWSLLMRLSNDIHCAAMLSLRGYVLQAMTLVSATYEVAGTISLIGGDDDLGIEWTDHDDPQNSFRGAFVAVHNALKRMGFTDAEERATRVYEIYRQLCWAKHANPLLQKHFNLDVDNEFVCQTNGPDTSEVAVMCAWSCLQYACSLALVALASFVDNHVPPEKQGEVNAEVLELQKQVEEIDREARKRWVLEETSEENEKPS